jgi:hypothetical protein
MYHLRNSTILSPDVHKHLFGNKKHVGLYLQYVELNSRIFSYTFSDVFYDWKKMLFFQNLLAPCYGKSEIWYLERRFRKYDDQDHRDNKVCMELEYPFVGNIG